MKRKVVAMALCFVIWLATILYEIIYVETRLDTIVIIALITIQLVASINDLYNKTISLKLLFIGMLMGYAGFLWLYQADVIRNQILGGVAAFLTMALLMVLSKSQIGGGDLWLMTVTGFFTGIYSCFSILFVSITLAGICSLMLLITKKVDRRTEIPFAPFILIATVVLMFSQ